MAHDDRDVYNAWLVGELLLVGLLGASLALFLQHPSLRITYSLPELRLVLQTIVAFAGTIVAVLAGVRFQVEGRRIDLLLCSGFTLASASGLAFSVGPVLGSQPLDRAEAWAGIMGRLVAWSLIASAAFVRGRPTIRERALRDSLATAGFALVAIWVVARASRGVLPSFHSGHQTPGLLSAAFALEALLNLAALVGFGLRYRTRGEDLDRWLSLGATLMLFASLHLVFTPVIGSDRVSQGDFLRILAYGVLLVGVWRAIRYSEFGRAVAEERARVAREIHDGLAQYLFAVSTHTSMLESGASLEETLPKLKEAAALAQQEARFAVLALSSASGSAPFDAALRRYVDFLTADGRLEVDLEIDPDVRLAPDEQIEVFRIVQEGLANVRKHADATSAEVLISEHEGRRTVVVRDNGRGFEEADGVGAGQGLKNIRARTESIEGNFRLRSRPGGGTALEVALRTD